MKKQGFASMTRERNIEVARKGGLTAQAGGKAHRYTAEEARAAGKIGGRKKRDETHSH